MALSLKDLYEYITGASAAYPWGSFKNATAPGAGDGTPFEKQWPNDIYGFLQAMLNKAGIVPSGAADTVEASQYLQALESIMWSVGDYKMCGYSTPGAGWLMANGNTLGSADSVANHAGNEFLPLFKVLWAEAGYVLKNNVGGIVARGANAEADWAANRIMVLPDFRGYFPRGWDHGRGVDPGRVLGSAQGYEIQEHSHGGVMRYPTLGPPEVEQNQAGGPVDYASYNTSTDTTGGTETRPLNIACMIAIRYL